MGYPGRPPARSRALSGWPRHARRPRPPSPQGSTDSADGGTRGRVEFAHRAGSSTNWSDLGLAFPRPNRKAQLRVVSGGHHGRDDLAHLSDEALISLVGDADELALTELYDRYSALAYGLALRILRDQSLAEDAVQEAFLDVWRAADTFLAERARPSTWILTFVHRRAVDLVRREQRRRTAPSDNPSQQTEAAAGPDEEVVLRHRRKAVQEALRRLPSEQREALELAYYGGLTQSELAERLGVPLGTIKSRMFAGLRRLADLLTKAEADLGVDVADDPRP